MSGEFNAFRLLPTGIATTMVVVTGESVIE